MTARPGLFLLKKSLVIVCVLAASFSAFPIKAEVIRPIMFPVQGEAYYTDTFNDGRSGGRSHEGIDIMAAKMTPVVAVIDGRIRWLTETEASYGWMVVMEDSEGYEYSYIHLNNDTPGTDDGLGGRERAIAPGIEDGASVTKGQLIGWVGDSGNAENTAPHLHFEIEEPGGFAINPYWTLLAAERPGRFDPEAARLVSPDINTEKQLTVRPEAEVHCLSGSLIKSTAASAVYFCGADAKRYVFPNDKTYFTWYADFSSVLTLSATELAAIPIGGNVTYRPGVKLLKIQSDPKVYAVDRQGTLRWVTTDTLAKAMYGTAWAKQVHDLSDAFFINYKVGDPITSAE
ncbi:MAG: M23 family metallopeptidase [Patescibacteria group bacterium]|jgi:hypothetical protein